MDESMYMYDSIQIVPNYKTPAAGPAPPRPVFFIFQKHPLLASPPPFSSFAPLVAPLRIVSVSAFRPRSLAALP